MRRTPLVLAAALALLTLAVAGRQCWAVDFHVATAQDLQNALTTAAANGADNNIYLSAGYYIGNFNYNSSSANNLTIANEPSVTNNTQIAIDGAGTGRDMNLANTGTGNITVQGITFLRNCGNSGIGALRIAPGSASSILVQNCQFLSPTNTSGMGLEIDSGLNATITNCTVTGTTGGGGGIGISIGVTGNVIVQNCMVATNYNGGVSVSGGVIAVTASTFTGNLDGCGAYCNGTTVTLTGNVFTGNSGLYGGGAYCGGTAIITGNTFAGNVANALGGGAYCGWTATITGNTFTGNLGSLGGGGGFFGWTTAITGNTFAGNESNHGGGAYCGGTATITGNTFTGNSADGSGGGANCSGATGVTLSNNTFTGNSSGGDGGGLDWEGGGSMTLSANTFNQNSAVWGGGICFAGQTITISDNLVANNTSSSGGGGVWVDATSSLFMINNTIFGNTAAGSGGGAAFEVTGTVELLNVYNNIIWGNSASGNGADVWLAGTGQKKTFLYNDVNNMYGVWDIAQNLLNADPKFFDPVNGDYHLQSISPCANAGTNGAPSLPLTDLEGNARTNSAGMVDLGCYEFNTTATHPADTNATFVITGGEFNAYAAAWKAGQSWTNAPASAPNPNPIPANYLTRAGYLLSNGGAYTNDGSARPTNWKPSP
jgi:hypothetical protein